jgi:hypothetical protein
MVSDGRRSKPSRIDCGGFGQIFGQVCWSLASFYPANATGLQNFEQLWKFLSSSGKRVSQLNRRVAVMG